LKASGGTVRSTGAWLAETYPQVGNGTRTRLELFLVLGISLVYAGISLATTLLMATTARRAELRTLSLTGATRGQILAVVVSEALVAVGVAGARTGVNSKLTAPYCQPKVDT
jgi:putative ABC transport system permease protein